MENIRHKDPLECTYVFLDLETSGKYPIQAEICEIAALKWKDGEYIDEFQTLIKTKNIMSKEVIKIHNITNEMIETAPSIEEKIHSFRDFIGDSICVAHHAPFDLGFLAIEFEKNKIDLPSSDVICTSLLARAKINNVINHRLQTLVKYFHLPQGQAHRALDDTKSCAAVYFNCLKSFNLNITLADVIAAQEFDLKWKDYSMNALKSIEHLKVLILAIEHDQNVSISYSGGSKPGEFRRIKPISVVRNPEGDFLVADDFSSKRLKRYFVHKITAVNKDS